MGALKLGNDYYEALKQENKIVDLMPYIVEKEQPIQEEQLEGIEEKVEDSFIPAPTYNLFSYNLIDDHKKPIFLNEYMMGGAWGMVHLYHGQPVIAERLKKNSILAERVGWHEGHRKQGHLQFGSDEVLTRIHTNTLDITPYIINDKYGA